MVLTRSGNNRVKNKKTTASTSSQAGTSAIANADTNTESDATEKQLEDLKLVASLVDWSSYDRMMSKVFYEKFGRRLEETLDRFEQTKAELKECIRRNCDNKKLLQTPPRKVKPATALLEQVNKFKQLNFDSDEEMDVTSAAPPACVAPADPPACAAPSAAPPACAAPAAPPACVAPAAPPACVTPPTYAVSPAYVAPPACVIPPICAAPITPKMALNTTIQKKQKLKEIEEKMHQAQKKKEEQLKEKAERTKKQREERTKLVEQKNRQLEQDRQEKLAQVKQHEDRVKQFVSEQKKLQLPRSPITTPYASKTPNASKRQQQMPPTPLVMPKKLSRDAPQIQKQKPQTPEISPILPHDEREISPIFPHDESEVVEASNYDITKEKVFLPSTEENYNVDDLSSADETDNDEQPRKTVPKWAHKQNLDPHIKAIRRLVPADRIERYFGQIRQPMVEELFKGYKKEYAQRRPSSAVWDSPMSDPTPGVGRYQNQFESP